jgi:hypothetical protein
MARSWLTGITRNLCRERNRTRNELPLEPFPVSDPSAGPGERLERSAVRDWVWAGLEALSEPLRHAVVLRYFSSANSYQAIAAALGIPVGTVRSRLNEARRVLARDLQDLAPSAHPDHWQLERTRALLFAGITQQYNRGADLELLSAVLTPDARLTVAGSTEVVVGREPIVRSLEDVAAGVRLRLLNVIAGPSITILEGAFENPPDHPEHCPPLTTQIMSHHGDEIAGIHLHYSGR